MVGYVVKRLAWMVGLLFGVSFLTFILFYLLPAAEPAALRAGKAPTPALLSSIRRQLGLNRPWYDQYLHLLDRLLFHLDFGYSYQLGEGVGRALLERLEPTASVALGAAAIWLVGALVIGALAAVQSSGPFSWLFSAVTLVGLCAPPYLVALVFLFLFARQTGKLGLLPGPGSYTPLSAGLGPWLEGLIGPWLVLAFVLGAFYARLLRARLREVLAEPYIKAARALGIPEWRVVVLYGLRAAVGPFLTAAGVDLGLLAGGALLTETAFNIPGIGRLLYESVLNGDLPLIEGTVIVGGFFIVLFNLFADLLHAWIDPRLRLQ